MEGAVLWTRRYCGRCWRACSGYVTYQQPLDVGLQHQEGDFRLQTFEFSGSYECAPVSKDLVGTAFAIGTQRIRHCGPSVLTKPIGGSLWASDAGGWRARLSTWSADHPAVSPSSRITSFFSLEHPPAVQTVGGQAKMGNLKPEPDLYFGRMALGREGLSSSAAHSPV